MSNLPATRGDNARLATLEQPTPDNAVLRRAGKGEEKFEYLPAAYVQRRLNFAFGHGWSFEVLKEEILYGPVKDVPGDSNPFEVVVLGRLHYTDETGAARYKDQYGTQVVEYTNDYSRGKIKRGKDDVWPKSNIPISIGQAKQGAATRALKKCAESLGIGLDLKKGGEAPEVEATAEDVRQILDSIGLTDDWFLALCNTAFGKAPVSVAAIPPKAAPMLASFVTALYEALQTLAPDVAIEDFAAWAVETRAQLSNARTIAESVQMFKRRK